MLVRFAPHAALVALAAVLGALTAAQAAELDPKAVQIKTPDQFKWRNPSMQAPNNAVLLGDPAVAGSLFVHINSFVPGKFGEAHYHPNDRYVLVVDGAPWRGTGNVVDPDARDPGAEGHLHDRAGRQGALGRHQGRRRRVFHHRDPAFGPNAGAEGARPLARRRSVGGQDHHRRTKFPGDRRRHTEQAVLAGDPSKPGVYVTMSKWRNGPFTHPHFHSADRYAYVLDGTWWVGTGSKLDPEHLAVPVKAGSLVREFAKGVLWAGARDEGATVLMFGLGPVSNTAVEEPK